MTEQAKVPAIRFAGFTDPWEQRKFGDCFEFLKSNTLSRAGLNGENGTARNVHYGDILIKFGDCLDGERSDLPFITDDTVLPKFAGSILREGDVIFADTAEDEAAGKCVELRKLPKEPTISGLHTIPARPRFFFGTGYLGHYLNSDAYHRQLLPLMQGIKVISVSKAALQDTQVRFPGLSEQAAIGAALSEIDNLITLHQRKYGKLVILKKSMLEKMFPKDGESVPEIRFAGFTDPWEQRKLGELVVIERGGSPRPIDEYITDDTNGLNWVKIGDAPSLGRYISKTSEKIKPEGLSKTRQVHPGDLILSNSMSFGRPYIMAIEGCIHDGWLLIRDEPKSFDPMYLCHMLGTPKMLNQYRMLASGSTVNNLNKELVSNASILMPCKSEQKVIGQFFNHLDDLITLHQRKLELLQNIKKSLLDKMFV